MTKSGRSATRRGRAGRNRLRTLEARCRSLTAETRAVHRLFEDQLRRTQKTEAAARVARIVAHDFNNVLAAILGSGDLLALHLDADDPGRSELDEMQRAAGRGATLTRQFILFGRSQALDAQRLDVNAIVRRSRATLRRLAGNRVDLDVRTSRAGASVLAEPGQIEQMLLNLVVNARDAVKNGGRIGVVVDVLALEQTAARYCDLPAGPYARVTVRDTGAGRDTGMQPGAFDPLSAAADSSREARLRLWVVHAIAKDAGGCAIVSAAPGRGTTVEVVLPLARKRGASGRT